MTGRGLAGLALAATVLVAACGGATATTEPGPTAGPASTSAPGPTAGTGQTPAPQTGVPVATAAGQGGSGGGFSGDPCRLLTAAEIEGVTGVTNAVGNSTPMADDKGACLWIGDDATMGAGVEIATGARAVSNWETARADADSEVLPGIGDEAVFSNALGTVFFLEDDVLFAVVAGPFFSEADVKKASSIELAKIVLGKL